MFFICLPPSPSSVVYGNSLLFSFPSEASPGSGGFSRSDLPLDAGPELHSPLCQDNAKNPPETTFGKHSRSSERRRKRRGALCCFFRSSTKKERWEREGVREREGERVKEREGEIARGGGKLDEWDLRAFSC